MYSWWGGVSLRKWNFQIPSSQGRGYWEKIQTGWGELRIWNFQGYQRNSMWNFLVEQGWQLGKTHAEFPWILLLGFWPRLGISKRCYTILKISRGEWKLFSGFSKKCSYISPKDAIPDLKAVAADDEVEPFPAAGLDTVWQLMFPSTAVATLLMRVWVLSRQLMEAGLFLLCNSSLTVLLISSVVFTGTGTMLPTCFHFDCPFWNESFTEDPYFQD